MKSANCGKDIGDFTNSIFFSWEIKWIVDSKHTVLGYCLESRAEEKGQLNFMEKYIFLYIQNISVCS